VAEQLCVLCAFHEENRHEPAVMVVNGTSVCEDHAIWMMRHQRSDTEVASHNFNLDVDNLFEWKTLGVEYG
jgi:hypothetical protein